MVLSNAEIDARYGRFVDDIATEMTNDIMSKWMIAEVDYVEQFGVDESEVKAAFRVYLSMAYYKSMPYRDHT